MKNCSSIIMVYSVETDAKGKGSHYANSGF
jgi:hypothetical protein